MPNQVNGTLFNWWSEYNALRRRRLPGSADYLNPGGGVSQVPPRVLSAQALTPARVRVIFDEPMAGSGLLTPANWTFIPAGGSAARTCVSVLIENPASPVSVILYLDGNLTAGTNNYTVTAALAVLGSNGVAVDAAHRSTIFSGPGPHATPDVTSHCDLAMGRLAAEFQNRVLLRAMICGIADRAQDVEQALTDLRAYRSLTTSAGAQLDTLGTFLGVPRNGLTDQVYAVRLRAQTQVNGSVGTPNQLERILQTLDNGFNVGVLSYHEELYKTAVLYCHTAAGDLLRGPQFMFFLRQAKPAGTRLILEFDEEGVILFQMQENGGPPIPAGSGMADQATPTVGGHMREAVS